MADRSAEPAVSEEQALYARIMSRGATLGLLLLVSTFLLYVTGLVPPAVPIEELPRYWVMDVGTYLETVNAEHLHRPHAVTGWAWMGLLHRGDFLNFLGIALLALVTIVCYTGILPTLLRRGDRAYAAMAAVEVVILVLAASGVLSGGHG